MIRRLRPKGSGPNWKVADIIPQPTPFVSGEVRSALAILPGTYALENGARRFSSSAFIMAIALWLVMPATNSSRIAGNSIELQI